MNKTNVEYESSKSLSDISENDIIDDKDSNNTNMLNPITYISNSNLFITNNIDVIFEEGNSLISSPFTSEVNSYYDDKKMNYIPYILNKYKNYLIFELTYKKKKNRNGKVRILCKKFIKNNKKRGVIIYNECEFELKRLKILIIIIIMI